MAEKVVLVSQDDNNNDGEGSGSDDLGTDDGEGSGSDDGKDKAMRVPFRTTPSGITWFKCHVFLEEEYDSEAKVVLHALKVIK
jgi:hypothetical protein